MFVHLGRDMTMFILNININIFCKTKRFKRWNSCQERTVTHHCSLLPLRPHTWPRTGGSCCHRRPCCCPSGWGCRSDTPSPRPRPGRSGRCWSGTGSAGRRTGREPLPGRRYQRYLWTRPAQYFAAALPPLLVLPPLSPLVPPGEDAEDADGDDDAGQEGEPQPHSEEYPGLGLDHHQLLTPTTNHQPSPVPLVFSVSSTSLVLISDIVWIYTLIISSL